MRYQTTDIACVVSVFVLLNVTNTCIVIFCSVGPIECSVTVNFNTATDTSVNVTVIWTNCLGKEPESVSLQWYPTEDPNNVLARDINTQTPAIITGLLSNTSYTIVVNFTDACGSITNMTNAITQPETGKCLTKHDGIV